jgi:hypothetical protein
MRRWQAHVFARVAPVALVVAFLLALVATGCGAIAQPSFGPAPTATAGDLRITTDHSTYSLISPIGVSVTNTGKADLYSLDGRSACAITQLQRYDTATRAWISLNGCSQAASPRVNRIVAGSTTPFTLAPTSSPDPNKWERGLYRVAVAFSANPDATTDMQTAFSVGFSVS